MNFRAYTKEEMRAVCAWCKRVQREGTPGAPTTHTICADCKAKELAKLKANPPGGKKGSLMKTNTLVVAVLLVALVPSVSSFATDVIPVVQAHETQFAEEPQKTDGWKITQEFKSLPSGVLVRCVEPMKERDQNRYAALLDKVKGWAAEFAKEEGLTVVTDKLPGRIVFVNEPVAYVGAISMSPLAGRCEPKNDRILINYNDNATTLLHEFAHWFFGAAASEDRERTHAVCHDFRDFCLPKWREIKKQNP